MSWTHEAIDGIEITAPAPRYVLSKAFVKARRALDPNKGAAIDELIERYRKAADEKPVAITARQLAEARRMTRMGAYRALEALVAMGFIVVFGPKGSYDVKRKPTRYRLTMFPCNGDDATHDYIEDVKEWKRQRGRKLADGPLPATVSMRLDKVPLALAADIADAVKPILDSF
jgi:hypothetical protein